MKLLHSVHAYSGDFQVDEGPGAPRFTHSNFIFIEDHTLFYAQSGQLPGSFDIGSLKVYQVPVQVFPEHSKIENITLALDPSAETYHTKYPNVIQFPDKPDGATVDRICASMLREIQVCEVLRLNPHPNVAEYIGCSVNEGRIHALCFVRYPWSLADRMRKGAILDGEVVLEGIRHGLKHLHSLGYCHNDIKPSNIMLKADGTPVISDYDSCQPPGEELVKGGTVGWNHASHSAVENDWACFLQIAQILGVKEL